MTYDQTFYDEIRLGAQRSAAAAAPIIVEQLGLDIGDTILDVGCGEGWWADSFAALGMKVTGIDSGHTDERPGSFEFIDQSLDRPLPNGTWDMIVCLEVAEHLHRRAAVSLVMQFRARSKCVLFSAARPGQGGTGHINEQPIGYWADLLSKHGFAVSGALRWHLWGNSEIENWYQQNMLVAIPATVETGTPILRGERMFPPYTPEVFARPHDVVHPVLFDARRHP